MNNLRNIPVRFSFPQGKDMIRFANQFSFSQIDMDVVMDICVVDPKEVLEMNQKVQKSAPGPHDVLEASVIQRVGLSISSFIKLKQQMDQIFESLEQQGVLVKHQTGESRLQ